MTTQIERNDGPPLGAKAPSGGSVVREATSLGARQFQWPVRVYWEDTDAGGIVFYANYLKYFERARTEWLRFLGIGQQQLKDETGCMFVVSETSLRYLRPARLDDQLVVTAQVVECGKASITLSQKVLQNTEQTNAYLRWHSGDLAENPPHQALKVLCEGTIRIGWVRAATLQPARIPSTLLEALQR